MPVSFFYTYSAIYFLLPRYILTGKYLQLVLILILISAVFIAISYLISISFDIKLAYDQPIERAEFIRRLDFIYTNGFVLPFVVSGFAAGIKMGKNFYLQQKRNEQLAKQKIEAEVQLLKSQVHPRFLFHSLNSIYNDMLNGAKQSPEMLLKLSELLSYILYESDKAMSLEKELLLLKNYIALEKAGWGKNLIVHISDNIKTEEQSIEPLLLLPLAEYIFIHADKNRNNELLLTLNMQLIQQQFYFTIEGKSSFEKNFFSDGAQLLQVQKRLQAQYPNKHEFNLTSDENSIFISLSLQLKNKHLN
ncbi:MAG: histidine kinase [Parafilimonas sp.]|nr:histidine kinase [Parafilimonas sp.]